jgi:hypothetical protein
MEGKLTKAKRLDIYQRNHVGARVKGLSNVYPVCEQILGEMAFERLANDHVSQVQSPHWDLNFHGKDFAEFLALQCQQHSGLNELFYLADLARLEWLFHICYYAPANTMVAPSSQDPELITFVADSSLYLFISEWPVQQIWQNNRDDQGEQEVEHNQEHYYHLIYREQFSPQLYNLEVAQYGLLKDCIAGKTLAQLAEIHGEVVSSAIPYFIEQHWLFLR